MLQKYLESSHMEWWWMNASNGPWCFHFFWSQSHPPSSFNSNWYSFNYVFLGRLTGLERFLLRYASCIIIVPHGSIFLYFLVRLTWTLRFLCFVSADFSFFVFLFFLLRLMWTLRFWQAVSSSSASSSPCASSSSSSGSRSSMSPGIFPGCIWYLVARICLHLPVCLPCHHLVPGALWAQVFSLDVFVIWWLEFVFIYPCVFLVIIWGQELYEPR